MNADALVLDFDGIIADSVKAHTSARLKAFQELGYADIDPLIHVEAHRHGSHPTEIIGWILSQAGVIAPQADINTDATVKKVVSLKSQIYFELAAQGLDPIPGAIDFIHWATAMFGVSRLAIATTATLQSEVGPFLAQQKLTDLFGVIVAKEDTQPNRMKPDPYVYLEVMRRLKIDATRSVAVEDHPKGVMSSKKAGLQTVGITTTHSKNDLQEADVVISSFTELRAMLNSGITIIT